MMAISFRFMNSSNVSSMAASGVSSSWTQLLVSRKSNFQAMIQGLTSIYDQKVLLLLLIGMADTSK
jgi:hypothetical protein